MTTISEAASHWPPPPEDLSLGKDEVHVWRGVLDLSGDRLDSLLATLSAEERVRAARFRFETDRRRFVAARGLLRAILARYLHIEPGRLRFRYSAYGKPFLTDEFANDSLRFNSSHSGGLALFAFTRGRQVGVDVEEMRSRFELEEIAERFFSRPEVATLRSLPLEERPRAFFDCWTRKEAYIKARGEGLSMPLDRFSVSLASGEPARLLTCTDDNREIARWSLRELAPGAGYVGALAVEGDGWELRTWQWAPQTAPWGLSSDTLL